MNDRLPNNCWRYVLHNQIRKQYSDTWLWQHPFIKSAKDAKVIKPLIDLASAIVRERGYRYQDESDGSSSEVGSDIEQAFEEVSFEVLDSTCTETS